MIAPKARNEPSASVDTPVSPCPIVQPSAVTPPKPIRMPPTTWLARSSTDREALPAERPRGERHGRRADEHAEHAGDAEGQHARLVGPEHQQLEQVRDRRR